MLRMIEPAADAVIVKSPGLRPGTTIAAVIAFASASASAAVHEETSPSMVIVVVMVFSSI